MSMWRASEVRPYLLLMMLRRPRPAPQRRWQSEHIVRRSALNLSPALGSSITAHHV